MIDRTRRARLRTLAKINLGLRVLSKRPDEYHELRTVFQTISLADTIDIAFTPSRKTTIRLDSDTDIPNNLVLRAAEACLNAMRITGHVEFRLQKRIPMGGGLGGGSSDAAAVLLSLPALGGRVLELEQLIGLASDLGSDVPFFLLGGTAAAVGRGTEVFPLPDSAPRPGILIVPGLHVSTAEAYRSLGSRLTTESQENKMVGFQSRVWSTGVDCDVNDFESVVFEQFPKLRSLKRRLVRMGAKPAMMSGSGSVLFGLFRTRDEVSRAINSLGEIQVFPISLVSRARYRSLWWRQLRAHVHENLWPPQSRYAR